MLASDLCGPLLLVAEGIVVKYQLFRKPFEVDVVKFVTGVLRFYRSCGPEETVEVSFDGRSEMTVNFQL